MTDIGSAIKSNFPNERTKAVINLKYTANWLDHIGNELLKPFQISLQQYNVLRILRGAKKAIKVTDVRERMIEKSPNATRLMDKLCEKKLIERERCENDRRVVYVKITPTGESLIQKINLDNYIQVMDNLSDEEIQTLNILLDKIRK